MKAPDFHWNASDIGGFHFDQQKCQRGARGVTRDAEATRVSTVEVRPPTSWRTGLRINEKPLLLAAQVRVEFVECSSDGLTPANLAA
jgi:hypothetical protein